MTQLTISLAVGAMQVICTHKSEHAGKAMQSIHGCGRGVAKRYYCTIEAQYRQEANEYVIKSAAEGRPSPKERTAATNMVT